MISLISIFSVMPSIGSVGLEHLLAGHLGFDPSLQVFPFTGFAPFSQIFLLLGHLHFFFPLSASLIEKSSMCFSVGKGSTVTVSNTSVIIIE